MEIVKIVMASGEQSDTFDWFSEMRGQILRSDYAMYHFPRLYDQTRPYIELKRDLRILMNDYMREKIE